MSYDESVPYDEMVDEWNEYVAGEDCDIGHDFLLNETTFGPNPDQICRECRVSIFESLVAGRLDEIHQQKMERISYVIRLTLFWSLAVLAICILAAWSMG